MSHHATATKLTHEHVQRWLDAGSGRRVSQHRQRLLSEVIGSKTQIEEQLQRAVDLFCYPNGDASPVAWWAHLGGVIAGALLCIPLRRREFALFGGR